MWVDAQHLTLSSLLFGSGLPVIFYDVERSKEDFCIRNPHVHDLSEVGVLILLSGQGYQVMNKGVVILEGFCLHVQRLREGLHRQ